MRALSALFFVASFLVALGPFPNLDNPSDFFREPPFVAGALGATVGLALTALWAAGDVDRRRGLIRILGAELLFLAVAAGLMLAFAETEGTLDAWVASFAVTSALWTLLGVGGTLALALLGASLGRRRHPGGAAGTPKPSVGTVLTRREKLLRAVLILYSLVFALLAIAAIVAAQLASSEEFARQLPLVVLTSAGCAGLAMLSACAASDLRRDISIVSALVASELATALAAAAYLIGLDTDYRLELLGDAVSLATALWVLLLAAGLSGLLTGWLYHRAWKARYGTRFLWPVSYRGLVAMADVLLEPDRRALAPEEVAQRVDGFLVQFKAHRRPLYLFALASIQLSTFLEVQRRPPFVRINPPLSELDRASRRRFLEDHFRRLPNQPWLRLVKHIRQITIRIAQQLAYAGYYGSREAFASIGYQPFTERPRYAELDIDEPGFHPLDVLLPETVDAADLEADVCIVGSGAAGSILAYELAKQGREVLVLERGDYVEPRQFNENEIEMIGRLYSDGLMQQTADWRFTILQGSTVGGSTTVNNAVCFPPPEEVLARWNGPELQAGIDVEQLKASTAAVERMLTIDRQDAIVLNNSAPKFVEGAKRLPGNGADVGVVRANIKGCYGSGYCNIGCRWGKKLSMLETALPWAQREHPGKVRIVAECEVVGIEESGGDPRTVTGLRAKLGKKREVAVRANEYILSAGAVASSYLMLRSRSGRGLPVGKGFSANMGAPLTAEFSGDPLNAYDGLQISHYGLPHEGGFVLETWFNPPVSQALNLPGWFEQHSANMRRYDHLMAVGVLVGTASNGEIGRAKTGGPDVRFTPLREDLKKLAGGLHYLSRVLLEGGAERVMVNTWGHEEFPRSKPPTLEDMERICSDPDYITLGTGHPQGGNAISRDPARGVVGPDFRVHGYSNLRICDASVFPTSLTVNPQLTVMALAHYAAGQMAGAHA